MDEPSERAKGFLAYYTMGVRHYDNDTIWVPEIDALLAIDAAIDLGTPPASSPAIDPKP